MLEICEKKLTNGRLYLRDTKVTDLSTLSTSADLEWLDLEGTEVTDFSFLSACKNLKGLNLRRTGIIDSQPSVCLRKS